LNAARHLLGLRKVNLTIAHDLGYGSSAAFTSMFRRVLGVPPRRYATLALENGGRGA
jgi:AraC-like DNA-binding protein